MVHEMEVLLHVFSDENEANLLALAYMDVEPTHLLEPPLDTERNYSAH